MASDVSTDNISTAQIDKFTLTPTLSHSWVHDFTFSEGREVTVARFCKMRDGRSHQT